jgi:hypothetical protein
MVVCQTLNLKVVGSSPTSPIDLRCTADFIWKAPLGWLATGVEYRGNQLVKGSTP